MRYLFFFLLLCFTSYGQQYDNAMTYLQFIDSHHADVVEQTWNYMYTYTQEDDYQKRNGQRKKLENILNRSIRYIKKETPYDKNLQEAAIIYLKGNVTILKEDYAALLKMDLAETSSENKNELLRKIRKAMLELRHDYDLAVKRYGNQFNININANNSALARQMQHTIQVYDYYHEVNMLVRSIKQAEADIWQNVTQLTPAEYESRLQELKKVVDSSRLKSTKLIAPSDNKNLQMAFLKFQNHFTDDFMSNIPDIIAILQAHATNDRSDIVAKTEAFNRAKTWFNINRSVAFNDWSQDVTTYLRDEIKPL